MRVNGYLIEQNSDLQGANFRRANLEGVDFRGCNCMYSDFRNANLKDSILSGVDLRGADFRGASLENADLSGSNLRWCNLQGSYLQHGAYLINTNIQDAILPDFQIPQEGTLTVFKRTREGVIKLLVPDNAKRTATLIGRKCRAEFVFVLETPDAKICKGFYDVNCLYEQGEFVYADKYDDDIRVECTNGIHFFLTHEEAERIPDVVYRSKPHPGGASTL